MKIKVLFFGPAKDAVGVSEMVIVLKDPCPRLFHLKKVLINQHSLLDSIMSTCMFSKNREYVSKDDLLLNDNDEIGIIPPVLF
jgi:molybdopterin converting factor small subunit